MDEEVEARDVLCIEMELDRDETMALIREEHREAGHMPRESAVRSLAEARFDGTSSTGVAADMGTYDVHTLGASFAFQVASAEQYERQSIAVRRGAFVRLVAELSTNVVSESPTSAPGSTTFGKLATLQHRLHGIWEDMDAAPLAVAPAAAPLGPKRRAPGMLLPAELRLYAQDDASPSTCVRSSSETPDTVARRVVASAAEHNDGRVEDGRHADDERQRLSGYDQLSYSPEAAVASEDPPPRRASAVVVPDAAQLGRVDRSDDTSAAAQEEGTRTDEGNDEASEDAYYEMRARLRLRDMEAARQDVENDESVEREFVTLAADEERRAFVHLFASCIVEEYDWSIGAFRTRMRCLPMLQPRAPRHAANRGLSTPYVPSPAERALSSTMKAKDRHLPQYMRTPVPPRQPVSPVGMRADSGLFMPAPPSSLSRLSHKGGDPRSVSRTTLSRLTDLIPLTGVPSPPYAGHEAAPYH